MFSSLEVAPSWTVTLFYTNFSTNQATLDEAVEQLGFLFFSKPPFEHLHEFGTWPSQKFNKVTHVTQWFPKLIQGFPCGLTRAPFLMVAAPHGCEALPFS